MPALVVVRVPLAVALPASWTEQAWKQAQTRSAPMPLGVAAPYLTTYHRPASLHPHRVPRHCLPHHWSCVASGGHCHRRGRSAGLVTASRRHHRGDHGSAGVGAAAVADYWKPLLMTLCQSHRRESPAVPSEAGDSRHLDDAGDPDRTDLDRTDLDHNGPGYDSLADTHHVDGYHCVAGNRFADHHRGDHCLTDHCVGGLDAGAHRPGHPFYHH